MQQAQEMHEAVEKAMAIMVIPNWRYNPGEGEGDPPRIWHEDIPWIPMVDPYAPTGQRHHASMEIFNPDNPRDGGIPVWQGPQEWCNYCAGSHIRGARNDVDDLHLKSDDEGEISKVNESDAPAHTLEEALRELTKSGKEAPPRRAGTAAAFCGQCGYYREQWSKAQGCECFRLCLTCKSRTCDRCICTAPRNECACVKGPDGWVEMCCAAGRGAFTCTVDIQGRRTWCDPCQDTCYCTCEGKYKCTHPGKPMECECPRKLRRWVSLTAVNAGEEPVCPPQHEWRRERKSRNRKSNVLWRFTELARSEVESPLSPPQPNLQDHDEEEQENQKYQTAVHMALGHDEHGAQLSNAAVASLLTRLTEEGAHPIRMGNPQEGRPDEGAGGDVLTPLHAGEPEKPAR